jgi:pSer/pThr/pTyr-binding forkhead associated (FHA) protein
MADSQRKVENQLAQLFDKRTGIFSTQMIVAAKILTRLIESLEEHSQPGVGGRWIAPNRFRVTVGQRIGQTVSSTPQLKTVLTAKIEDHIRNSELILFPPIELEIETDSALREDAIRVEASTVAPEGENGRIPEGSVESIAIPPGAFLIINGRRHFPLNRPVVNIGRQLDNHLVLDDVLVSRRHAQLRVRDGQFTLLDLESKHGLRVNNALVHEWVLQPGDVLRLGNTELIYGDDREESITQPIRKDSATPPPPNPAPEE